MKQKFKNYGLWVSLFSLLGLVLSDLGIIPVHYSQYVEMILCILVTAGIVSTPEAGKWYADKTKKTTK